MKLTILLSQILRYSKSSFIIYNFYNLEQFNELLCAFVYSRKNGNNHTISIIGLFDF